MSLSKDELLALVRKGARNMSWQEKLRLTVLLSMPAMVAQLSSVAMQIIDAVISLLESSMQLGFGFLPHVILDSSDTTEVIPV